MLTKKGNPAPTVTTATVNRDDAFRYVIQAGRTTRTAALELCYSAACFILIVNHFTDAKDKKAYMTKSDAVAYLQKEIDKQAGVKGGMLDIYIRNASTLVSILTGSSRMFSSTIQALGTAGTPADMTAILSKWLDDNAHRKIESMSALSEALGYKTGREAAPATMAEKIERAPSKVATAVKNIEKLVTESKGKLRETAVAQAIVNNVSSKVTVAVEAIKAIVNDAELDTLENAIKTQRKTLKSLSVRANEEVKAAGKGKDKAPPAKAKGKPVHTQA